MEWRQACSSGRVVGARTLKTPLPTALFVTILKDESSTVLKKKMLTTFHTQYNKHTQFLKIQEITFTVWEEISDKENKLVILKVFSDSVS